MSLHHLRKQIDRMDDQIVRLLIRRLELAQRIGNLKMRNGNKVYNRRRERQILSRLSTGLKGPLTDRELRSIYQRILKVSRDHQKRVLTCYFPRSERGK